MEECVKQPTALTRRSPELGGAAEVATAGNSTQLGPSSTDNGAPFLVSVTSQQLQLGQAEGAADHPSQLAADEVQHQNAARSAALAGLQQRPPQRRWSQRFCDGRLEQRFRLYQARMLQPVDFKAALICLVLFLAVLGFGPATESVMSPPMWLLLLGAPELLALLASRAPDQWYQRHRETILMCAVSTMLLISGHFLVPFSLDGIDAQLLRSPAVMLKLSTSPAAIYLLLTFRIRVCIMFPFSLLLACCVHFTQYWAIAAAHEAAGLASASSIMPWGILSHLTAGVLLPLLVASCMERRERRQFLHEEASEASDAAKHL